MYDPRTGYKLTVSYNGGASYKVQDKAETIEELLPKGAKLDAEDLRWCIEDRDGEPVVFCAIHRRMIAMMLGKRSGWVRAEEPVRFSKVFLSQDEMLRIQRLQYLTNQRWRVFPTQEEIIDMTRLPPQKKYNTYDQ